MARTIVAVYEKGVFRPLQPVDLAEGQRVEVTLPSPPVEMSVEEMNRLAHQVFEGLTDQEIAEIEANILGPHRIPIPPDQEDK